MNNTPERPVDVLATSTGKTLKEYISSFKEPIALLLSLGSSIWLFVTNLKVSHSFKEFSANVNYFLTFVEFLNVCVLIAAIIMLSRKYTLKKRKSTTPNLIKLEPVNSGEDSHKEKAASVEWKIDRVNKLVAQLVISLQGFGVVLLFMYVLLSLTDLEHPWLNKDDKKHVKVEDFINDHTEISNPGSEFNLILDKFKNKKDQAIKNLIAKTHYSNIKLKSYDSLITKFVKQYELSHNPDTSTSFIKNYKAYKTNNNTVDTLKSQIKAINNSYYKLSIDSFCQARGELAIIKMRNSTLETKRNLIDMAYKYDRLDRFAMRYLIIEFVENAFNLFSGVFLFLAFQVLFTVTLSEDNRTSRINYWLPLSIAGAILLVNFLGITIGIGNMPLSSISHLTRLMSGIYNGIGMMLLFGRFISIEYFYKKADGFKRGFYYVGTIFILPFYAIAQPLYGIFDLDNKDIGNALILKSVVLLICFIGKLFLFLFISLILEYEWIHKYFYWILLNGNSMDNVSDQIEEDLEITH